MANEVEFELLCGRRFATREQARREVMAFVDYYNRHRRHCSLGMRSPINYQAAAAAALDTGEQVVA